MSMKNLVIIVLLSFTFCFAKSFKDLWHCEGTCNMKDCNYNNKVSIYFKYIDGKYNNTICHQYKGDKEYCTKIIEEYEEIDNNGEVIAIVQGEAVSYGIGNNRLFLIYEDHSVGHFECVIEYNVK